MCVNPQPEVLDASDGRPHDASVDVYGKTLTCTAARPHRRPNLLHMLPAARCRTIVVLLFCLPAYLPAKLSLMPVVTDG